MWRILDGSGWEYCRIHLGRREDPRPPWAIRGTVLAIEAGEPTLVNYSIDLREASVRLETDLEVRHGARRRYGLRLKLFADGRWENPGPGTGDWQISPELEGATDLDLEFSPLTNTFPIRRLNLAVGESAELVAAWVRFPRLTVEPLPQRYTRLSESVYRYESDGFSAEVEVDDLGLVVRYGDLWERVAVSDGNAD
jgi:hypothetical protein